MSSGSGEGKSQVVRGRDEDWRRPLWGEGEREESGWLEGGLWLDGDDSWYEEGAMPGGVEEGDAESRSDEGGLPGGGGGGEMESWCDEGRSREVVESLRANGG